MNGELFVRKTRLDMTFTLYLSSLRFTHSNELGWLDTVFQGQYFLSLSINYFEKLLL